MNRGAPRARAALSLMLGALACSGTAWLLARTATSAWHDLQRPVPDPDNAIAFVAALGGLVICVWLGLAATLTAATAGARRAGPVTRSLYRAAEAMTPPTVRRLVVVAVGVSLAAAAAPAQAASGTVPGSVAAGSSAVEVLWGTAPSPVSAPGVAPRTTVVVRPGDTLWAVAAAHLPAGSSAAEVARAWPQWFAANRHVIGDDPDHLTPGQRLLSPSSSSVPHAATTPGAPS